MAEDVSTADDMRPRYLCVCRGRVPSIAFEADVARRRRVGDEHSISLFVWREKESYQSRAVVVDIVVVVES